MSTPVAAPPRAAPALAQRLAGVLVVAVLVVLGLILATRPVGDEGLRGHATELTQGTVVSTRTTWDGAQLLGVSWLTGTRELNTQFEADGSVPPWQVGDPFDLLYDPSGPGTDAVIADPIWTFNSDYRVSAAFQSVVPFTLAVLALALLVIWPTRPSAVFAPEQNQRATRSLRRYVLTPAALSAIAVIAPIIVQDQHLAAYSYGTDNVTGALSVLPVILLVWLCVRAVRFCRLRRQMTVVQDAADNAAVVSSLAGRRMWVDARVVTQDASGKSVLVPDGQTACVQLAALPGQRRDLFAVGDRLRLYTRGTGSGPTLITDGNRMLLGRGRRRRRLVDPDLRSEPEANGGRVLVQRYPAIRRSLWRYVLGTTVIALVETAGSVALAVSLFGNVPGDGGDALAWLVFFLFTWATVWWPMTLYRWRGLARLVRGPYATRHGMVIDVSRSALRTTFGATVATIQLPGETAVRIRLISGQRLSWLSVGQDVDLMEQAPIKARPVVLARPGGQVALGIARHGEPDTAMRLARATEPSESH